MLPTAKQPLSPPAPTSDIPHPTFLPTLSPEDRTKLSTLFRTRGDAVSFAHLREEDPLETLLWLDQPHIKPWHDAITNAHRDHEATETHLSLARALRDITRILDLEADSTLRIRAVNAIIKLANAIHRSRATNRATDHRSGWSVSSSPSSSPLKGASDGRQGSRGSPRRPSAPLVAALLNPQHPSGVHESLGSRSPQLTKRATELRRAQENAEDAALRLKVNLERRANRALDLEDANAPVGAKPIETELTTGPTIAAIGPMGPIGPILPVRTSKPALSAAHLNGKHTARAGTPRPPPDQPKRRHRR